MRKVHADPAAGWAQVRLRGRRTFIVGTGLRYGLAMFILMNAYSFLLSPDRAASLTAAQVLARITVSAVVWALAGVAFGAWLWRSNERRFGPADDPAHR